MQHEERNRALSMVRDRSMPLATVVSNKQASLRSRGMSSHSSMGSLTGSNLSIEDRQMRIFKYWEKKKQRMNKKHVRYHCRKDLAENRFRYHGRFISKEQMDKILSSQGGLEEIYNPSMKCTPKTKVIFKCSKVSHRSSSFSMDQGTEIGQFVNPFSNFGIEGLGNPFLMDDLTNNVKLFGNQTSAMNLAAGT